MADSWKMMGSFIVLTLIQFIYSWLELKNNQNFSFAKITNFFFDIFFIFPIFQTKTEKFSIFYSDCSPFCFNSNSLIFSWNSLLSTGHFPWNWHVNVCPFIIVRRKKVLLKIFDLLSLFKKNSKFPTFLFFGLFTVFFSTFSPFFPDLFAIWVHSSLGNLCE